MPLPREGGLSGTLTAPRGESPAGRKEQKQKRDEGGDLSIPRERNPRRAKLVDAKALEKEKEKKTFNGRGNLDSGGGKEKTRGGGKRSPSWKRGETSRR